MPSYRGHLVGGGITYLVTYHALSLFSPLSFSIDQHLFFLGITLLGAIFPDIDVYSKMQQIFFQGAFLVLLVGLFTQNLTLIIGLSFLCSIILITKHRGITHQWSFLVLLSLCIYIFTMARYPHLPRKSFLISILFLAGSLSHIALDYGPRRLFRKKRRYK